MTLVEEYYELNEAEEVPAIWKVLQILFYGTAAGLGLWCGFTIAVLRVKFGDRCYLFTKVHKSKNKTVILHDVDWESDLWCDFYQFSLVSSFIVAVIWAAFFLMCGKGGKSLTGLTKPWRIVWPSLVFNLIYFVVILSASVNIQQGTDFFCDLHESIHKRDHDPCRSLHILINESELDITTFEVTTVPKTSWACTFIWLLLFLLSFTRIFFLVDFRMYKVCVFRIDDTIQNKKEEVLKVTNYEEPSQMEFEREEVVPRVKFQKKDSRSTASEDRSENFQTPGQFGRTRALAFEQGTDGVLSRQRSKNPRRGLDEDFEKHLRLDRRKLIAVQGKTGVPEVRPFFRQQTKTVYEDDENLGSTSTTEKNPYDQDLDPNHPLTFKKLI